MMGVRIHRQGKITSPFITLAPPHACTHKHTRMLALVSFLFLNNLPTEAVRLSQLSARALLENYCMVIKGI